MPLFREFMLFFRAYALLQGDFFMPFFRAIDDFFFRTHVTRTKTSTDVYIFWLNRDIAVYNQLLPHTRWKMVHANLRGKLELIWLYGDPIEGWHSEQGHHIDWRPMHAEVALKVESAFNSWTTHVYRKVGNHLYDFCAMCQVNMITGTRRPIRRLFRDHDAR